MSSVTLASSVADCMRGAFAFQSARHVGTHVLPDREIFCTVLFFFKKTEFNVAVHQSRLLFFLPDVNYCVL